VSGDFTTARRVVAVLCLAALLIAVMSPAASAWLPALLSGPLVLGADMAAAPRLEIAVRFPGAPHLPEPSGRGPPSLA